MDPSVSTVPLRDVAGTSPLDAVVETAAVYGMRSDLRRHLHRAQADHGEVDAGMRRRHSSRRQPVMAQDVLRSSFLPLRARALLDSSRAMDPARVDMSLPHRRQADGSFRRQGGEMRQGSERDRRCMLRQTGTFPLRTELRLTVAGDAAPWKLTLGLLAGPGPPRHCVETTHQLPERTT